MAIGEKTAQTEEEKQQVAAIQKSNKEILDTYSAAEMKAAILSKLDNKSKNESADEYVHQGFFASKKTRRFMTVVGYAALLCMAILIPLNISNSNKNFENDDSAFTNRVKGNGSRLFVYRKEGEKAVRLKTKTEVTEGDILQISYVAAGEKYGVIFSIDGNGVITQHFPDSGISAGTLEAKGEIALEFSYRLDDAPQYERFVMVSSNEPFKTSLFDLDEKASQSIFAGNNGKKIDFSKFLPQDAKVTDVLLLKK